MADAPLSLCARAPAEVKLPVTVEAMKKVYGEDEGTIGDGLTAVARLLLDAVRAGAASITEREVNERWFATKIGAGPNLCRWYLDTALARACEVPHPDLLPGTVAVLEVPESSEQRRIRALEERLAKCAEFAFPSNVSGTRPTDLVEYHTVCTQALAAEVRRLGGGK